LKPGRIYWNATADMKGTNSSFSRNEVNIRTDCTIAEQGIEHTDMPDY
jgi:hypothetical protein